MKSVSFESLIGLKQSENGLTGSEVVSQRARFGANDIVEVAGHPLWELLLETLKDPMIWFLLSIGTVFWLTGQSTDAITLFVAVIPLLAMDAVLHWRTQASTAALKGQLNARARVIREAREIQVDSRELVPGDLLPLASGELLPADGIFESARELQVDESVLTGEAFPIVKKPTDRNPFHLASLGEVKVEAETLGYAGTRVLTGAGHLRVLSTGVLTSYGEIVQSVARVPHERTPLQKSISRLVELLIYVSLAFCLLLTIIRIYQGHGWLDALLSAATLAVAAIPEEFPVVFTFFLGVGVYRLAKRGALVRRAVSVENIGRVTQVCTDKTGTITVGRLSLTHIDPQSWISPEQLIEVAVAASNSDSDPVDLAIHAIAQERKITVFPKLKTIPFTEGRKRETGFVANGYGDGYMACMKGSPESVLAMAALSEQERFLWKQRISVWAKEGHKVIACARKSVVADQALIEPASGFEFCGLLAFEDPARPEVAEAMRYCRESGIRVMMITGDHPDTAAAIARDAGLVEAAPRVLSAENEPGHLESEWLSQHPDFLKTIDVVARCTPLQKLKIVTALKASGELVAVTGDGVNDVPALKAADIGIAMGERGTRSAKEVSSIILSDDNFSTLINAIREGRQLFRNLKMSFVYLLLIHIPLVLTAAFVPLFGFPLVYLPVHIVWLELVIHPTALLAFQASSGGEQVAPMGRGFFFSKLEIIGIVVVGVGVAIALGFSFVAGVGEGLEAAHARSKAMAFLTLWSAGIVLGLTRLGSVMATLLAAATVLVSALLIQSSSTLEFLRLAPLHARDWVEVVIGVAVFGVLMAAFRKKGKGAMKRRPW